MRAAPFQCRPSHNPLGRDETPGGRKKKSQSAGTAPETRRVPCQERTGFCTPVSGGNAPLAPWARVQEHSFFFFVTRRDHEARPRTAQRPHALRRNLGGCCAWQAVCSSNTRGSKFLSTRFSSRLMPAAGCETTGPKQNARRSQITRRTHKTRTDIVVKNAAIMLRKEKSMSPSGARRTLSKAPF